jgi:CheY-like chemotaxis protein
MGASASRGAMISQLFGSICAICKFLGNGLIFAELPFASVTNCDTLPLHFWVCGHFKGAIRRQRGGPLSSLHNPELLLIQNDESTVQAFNRLLSSIGGSVRSATTSAQALAALDREPSLIVLDLSLPGEIAVEVFRAVRAKKLRSKVAVISSINQKNVLLSVTPLLPDAIFSSPIDFEDFIDWFSSISADLPDVVSE